MIVFLFLIVLAIIIFGLVFFTKFVEWYEYKHCLNCPLKGDIKKNEFDVFLENIKNEMELPIDEKKL